MEIRKTEYKDIDRIMEIISMAQKDFRDKNIDQWQNNYPNKEIIKEDVEKGESYVLLKDGIIIGTVCLSFDKEKTYDSIYDGEWLSLGRYGVIHRMVFDEKHRAKGLSSFIMESMENICIEEGIYSIKVDTHKENSPMQKVLERNDYSYCGIIILEDGSPRVAFEKLLK